MVGRASAVPAQQLDTVTPRMSHSTETDRRKELARTLRELRAATGMSGMQAAKAARFSQAKISRLERGVNVPTLEDVRTLTDVYNAPRHIRRRLEELTDDVREEFRRVVLHRGAADFQRRVGQIEESSQHIRTFTATIVPGLLQTADYARAVFRSGDLAAADVDAAVAAWLSRQELLRESGRRFTLVTTEGALRWCAESPTVMAAQMDHIAAATSVTGVRVGIISWGTVARVFPLHSWDIYDHRTVIVGTTTATAILTNRQDIDAYDALFTELEEMAVYGDDARRLLAQIAHDYREA
ncbi:MAG: helix-turn-helix domain-containing protein [Actinophytocola sp.]|nr:helix-turn-helix domain-containing protein [Actinophytocola sp.]